MICPECNKAELSERYENHRYTECGLDNVILANILVEDCPACGAHLVNIPCITGLHRVLAMALISKAERLAPQEVKFLRKSLGWSGVDFATQMHVTPETVSRWESTTKPHLMDEPYELLLRMAVAHGKRIEEYEVNNMAKVARFEPKNRRYQLQQVDAMWQVAV